MNDAVSAKMETIRCFRRSNVLGYPVDQMTLDDCIDFFETVIREKRFCHIVVINAAKVVKAKADEELKAIIHAADLVGADGVPIVWASRLLDQPLPGRVNGTDLMHKIFVESSRKGWRLYLLGARQDVIENAVRRINAEMPNIYIVGYRNGYFDSIEEEERVVDSINACKPDVLLLGFGTPMKEKWVKRHQERLRVPVIHGVGGSFDIVGGFTKRAPMWMQRYGLEWLYRLVQEPGRMWKRYLVTNWLFTWLVLKAWLRRIVTRSKTSE